MLNWRCPHCRAPQPEAARCWVCRKSSTTCVTCAHFRRSIAGGFGGTCGLYPRRSPLRGDELRGCWQPPLAAPGREAIPIADPFGLSRASPGSLWADPDS